MNEQDYDNDGNNIVPCPICLDAHCPSKYDKCNDCGHLLDGENCAAGGVHDEHPKCPKEDEFARDMKNESTLRQGVEGVMEEFVKRDLELWLLRLHNEPKLWKVDQALTDIRSRIPSMAEEILGLVREEFLQAIDDYWAGKYVTFANPQPIEMRTSQGMWRERPVPKPVPTLDQYFIASDLKRIIASLADDGDNGEVG